MISTKSQMTNLPTSPIDIKLSGKSRISPNHVAQDLSQLSRDMTALKKRGDVQVAEIQELAERTWRLNLAYERRLSRFENEKNHVIII